MPFNRNYHDDREPQGEGKNRYYRSGHFSASPPERVRVPKFSILLKRSLNAARLKQFIVFRPFAHRLISPASWTLASLAPSRHNSNLTRVLIAGILRLFLQMSFRQIDTQLKNLR